MFWLKENYGLKGKHALVTGASKGIGAACAISIARAGANLTLWGRDEPSLSETKESCEEHGVTVHTVSADMSDLASVTETANKLLLDSKIDILINNAGTISRSPAIDTTLDDWQKILDINLNAVFALTQIIARPMLVRESGSIINIASLLSFQGGINVPAYTASKHAVAGLTKALANEWAKSGVTVNAIAPGYISTDNTEALRNDPERNAAILARIPMGRWGDATDISGAAVFLASKAARYITGHVLVVDGGWLAR